MTRKHHCRRCGRVVCSTHSAQRVILVNINKIEPQRVCDNCFPIEDLGPRISNPLTRQFSSPKSPSRPESTNQSNNNIEAAQLSLPMDALKRMSVRYMSVRLPAKFDEDSIEMQSVTSSVSLSVRDVESTRIDSGKESSPTETDTSQPGLPVAQPESTTEAVLPAGASLPSSEPLSTTDGTANHQSQSFSVPISFVLAHGNLKHNRRSIVNESAPSSPPLLYGSPPREDAHILGLIELRKSQTVLRSNAAMSLPSSLPYQSPAVFRPARSVGNAPRGRDERIGFLSMLAMTMSEEREARVEFTDSDSDDSNPTSDEEEDASVIENDVRINERSLHI
jgi:hypothetical protein